MNTTIEIIITILCALVLCFFGYRLKKIAFAIIWFIVGYYVSQMYLVPKLGLDGVWPVILPIACGLLCSMFSMTIEKLCVFFTTMAVITFAITAHYGGGTYLWVGLGVGAIFGAIAVAFMKPMVILVTAYGGASALAMAAVSFSWIAKTSPIYYVILIAFLAIGALYQYKDTKHIE